MSGEPHAGPPGDVKDFAGQIHSDSSSTSTEPEETPSPSPVPPTSIQDAPPISMRMPPSLRASSDPHGVIPMSASSQPLGIINNARKPPSLSTARAGGGLPQDMQAKMKAFHLSRQGTPPGGRPGMGTSTSAGPPGPQSPNGGGMMGGVPGLPGGLHLPPGMRPQAHNFNSAPAVPRMGGKLSLSERRKMHLGGLPGGGSPGTPPTSNTESKLPNQGEQNGGDSQSGSMFSKFSEIVDTKAGTLNFAGKAVIHGGGIDFSSGNSFSISLDEVDTLEELGKGNYGTVYKVRHARPKMRRPGLGLAGNKQSSQSSPLTPSEEKDSLSFVEPASTNTLSKSGPTGVVMAMKEIRLELDEAKFAAIIMELDVLHRCISPYIVDFYGAFFQEGAVYICLEFMDGGSIDKLYGDGIPESILRKITYATTVGLKTLKDKHNIIHRDVKPTNILVNTRGQVKICDFGVSGNLVASIAKTNIGCQSYMAPERISGGGVAQAGANPGGGTYSVQSDIWSLGLTIIECAMGRYPYPPETYNNIFSQLSVSYLKPSVESVETNA